MIDEELLGDLATVFKGVWDASWSANNMAKIEASYNRIDAAIVQNAAMREIVEAVADSHDADWTLNYHVYAPDTLRTKARALLAR